MFSGEMFFPHLMAFIKKEKKGAKKLQLLQANFTL